MQYSLFVALSLFLVAAAGRPQPLSRRASFTLQNGQDAIALNNKFAALDANSACQSGEDACVDSKFAQCVNGKFVLQQCGGGLICAALPLVNSPGTSITCTTAADRDARIAATGAKSDAQTNASSAKASATKSTAATKTSAAAAAAAASATAKGGSNTASGNNGNDPQTSLTLLDSVIAKGFAQDGQAQPEAGQVPSLTSSNNFINFCATVPDLPLTNGQQIKTGSCNPAPMGVIAAATNMPASKFVFPKNNGKVSAGQNFTIQMAVSHLATGNFVNANDNYFAAPQQVNAQGDIKGHSHVVIEQLAALDTTQVTDPTKFVFFKGLNDPAKNGVLSTVVAGGLPKGTYRLASINTAANHQPALVAVAQHGALDDMV
ncbi:hypothetical protein BD311DRAFT_649352 [Dichomitus squalens]|uniref:Carbohydrate-binding module family 19 domain-containing protein n=1 Tax=Dichomitus squalens TaxID=114155 RepID=A0A4Q9N4J0_9APHY|nr:hypothetical protein BD311DRAFT_649352 [Dichomitus squalens]